MLSSQVSGQVTACILLGLLMTCFDPGKTLLRPVLFVPFQTFDARDNSSIYLDNKAINTFLCISTQETTPHLHINFLKVQNAIQLSLQQRLFSPRRSFPMQCSCCRSIILQSITPRTSDSVSLLLFLTLQ